MIRFLVYLFSSRVFTTVIAIVVGSIINHTLGPENRGQYAEVTVWMALFFNFFGLSITKVMFHYSNQERYKINFSQLAGSMLAIFILLSLLTIIGILLAVHFFGEYFSSFFKENILLIIIGIVGYIAADFGGMLNHTQNQIPVMARVGVTGSLASLFGTFFLALTGHLTIHNIIILVVIVKYIITAMHVKNIAFLVRGKLSSLLWLITSLIVSGMKIHFATIMSLLYVMFDQIMVFNITGKAETGSYSVAVSIVMSLMIFPQALRSVIYPRFIQEKEKEDIAFLIRINKYSIYAFAAVLLILYYTSGLIVQIYAGASYKSATFMLGPLILGVFFYSVQTQLFPFIIKFGLFGLGSLSAVLLFLVNIGLNLLLIPKSGGVGAAQATCITYFAGAMLNMTILVYYGKVRIRDFFLFEKGEVVNLLGRFNNSFWAEFKKQMLRR